MSAKQVHRYTQTARWYKKSEDALLTDSSTRLVPTPDPATAVNHVTNAASTSVNQNKRWRRTFIRKRNASCGRTTQQDERGGRRAFVDRYDHHVNGRSETYTRVIPCMAFLPLGGSTVASAGAGAGAGAVTVSTGAVALRVMPTRGLPTANATGERWRVAARRSERLAGISIYLGLRAMWVLLYVVDSRSRRG
ncbi:hypothetical protein BD410DRAFT_579983 [Rickenella mellea]|uniref:Uncharacterized protein n=1 Tax=Rickenella mellea TaxID=50990 RepID=A0A4Y7PPW5_9AGAM|nr:hypothetical protein BD410DRAFT_579983 [Rickenella mellea]